MGASKGVTMFLFFELVIPVRSDFEEKRVTMFQMNSLKAFSTPKSHCSSTDCFTLVGVLLTGWWSELDPVLPGGSALRRAVDPGLALIRSWNFHQQRPWLCPRCSGAAENHVLLSGASPQPRLCLLRDNNCSLQRCYSWGLLFFPQQRPSVPALRAGGGEANASI